MPAGHADCQPLFKQGLFPVVQLIKSSLHLFCLYHNTKDAVSEFSKKYNCDFALAEEYLRVVRGIRNQQPFYVTDEDGEETGEDVALDDTWNYSDILWNGIQAEKVQRAFVKLNYREQTLFAKRFVFIVSQSASRTISDVPFSKSNEIDEERE